MKTRIQKSFSFFLILVLVCTGVELPAPKVAHAITCGAGSDIGGGQCRVFLTSGTSWTVPSDWSSTNTVEAIGGGGGGADGTVGGSPSTGAGGGGEYRKIANFTGAGTISYSIGTGGAAGVAGGDTTWNGTTLVAKGGSPGSSSASGAGGTGGTGAAANYNGGAGGTATGHSAAPGGGGAGGPLGVGGAGGANLAGGGGAGGGGNGGGSAGSATGTGTGGDGGNNQAGSGHGVGGAEGAPPVAGTAGTSGGGGGAGGRLVSGGGVGGAGGAGSTGTEWDSTHGSGGGGGSAGSSNTGPATTGAGGLYGGGGGGGSTTVNAPVTPGGAGAQGIIVITYSSFSASIDYVRANATAGSLSTTLDIGTASTNRLVVVYAMTEADSATGPSGVTVDGKSCVQVQTAYNTNGAGSRTDLWYCDEDNLGASNGSVTITVTRASGTAANWAVHAQLFIGITQSGPRDSGVDTTSVSTNTSVVAGIDVAAGGIVTMGTANGQQALTNLGYTSPLTEVTDADPSSADAVTAQGTESSVQSNKTYTHTWSGTHNRASAVAASWDVIFTPTRTMRLFGSLSSAPATVAFASGQSWTVPAGITSIAVKAWGAAGGSKTSQLGGGGGFAQGTLSVTPGESLIVKVGGGGQTNGTGGTNGGGASGNGAGAGGYSGLFRSSVSQANALIIAGGGGSGGAGTNAGGGGAGGGSSGADASTGSNGLGGTQSAGGAGNGGGGTGTALQGGNGGTGDTLNGGAGGGGYYGGGGGNAGSGGSGAGGGGSGFVTGTATTLTTGSAATVANAGDANYPGSVGNAVSTTNGQDGYLVISYSTSVVRTLRIIGSGTSSVPINRTAKTVTANGNAQVDTAQSKFGGASALFDGTGDYLSSADSDDWDFPGDATIDLWIYPTGSSGTGYILTRDDGTAATGVAISINQANGHIGAWYGTKSFAAGAADLRNAWHHIALVIASGNGSLYVDGVSVSTITAVSAISGSRALSLGVYFDSLENPEQYYTGSVDEVRVSKGVARWTSNFTPPTSAYNTNDTYTKLLLHADGADTSTTFTDDVSETFAPNRSFILYH